MDWTLSHVPPDYVLTGLGLVPFLLVLIWVLVEELAPRAADRACWVLREFVGLMGRLAQDIIAWADRCYPDSERRS